MKETTRRKVEIAGAIMRTYLDENLDQDIVSRLVGIASVAGRLADYEETDICILIDHALKTDRNNVVVIDGDSLVWGDQERDFRGAFPYEIESRSPGGMA